MSTRPSVRRIAARVGVSAFLSNLAGAALAYFFLTFLAPEREGRPFGDEDAISLLVLVVYVGFTLIYGVLLGQGSFRHIGQWATSTAARPPSNEERDEVIGLPAQVSRRAFGFWLGGAIVFSSLNALFGNPITDVLRVGTGIVLAGLTTAALTFVLVEREVRPLVAQALGGEVPEDDRYLGVRPRLMLAWALGSGLPLASILGVISSHRVDGEQTTLPIVFLATVGLVVGWLLMYSSSRTIAEPLNQLRKALARVGAGDLDVSVRVDDGGEVGRLQAGFNQMAAGLRERQEIEELFGRHVGTDVARRALERPDLGGEHRIVTAMFVDLTGSTRMALEKSPAEVVRTLNDFFEAVVETVHAHGGWVNKFQGDGALCVFGAPADQVDHAARALAAGRRLRQALADLATLHPGLEAGIGISSGPVVAGNIGAEARYEYTVIGDPVNEAARLTEAAKDDSGGVLAGKRTIEQAGEEARAWEPAGTFELRGRVGATRAFRPIDGSGGG